MRFGCDITGGVNGAVELMNTAPEIAGAEQLADPPALEKFLRAQEFGYVDEPTESDLEAVHELRNRLDAVVTADSMELSARLVNEVIADAGTTPRVTNHDGHDWHIDFHTPGSQLGQHLGAEMAMALATLMTSGGRERIRRCEAPDCERILVDLSRNGSRRYCQGRNCGNRMAVQAYRARKHQPLSP